MGLFSSKKKIVVNTTVQRMFEDADLPNSAKIGVIRSINSGQEITDSILEEYAGSLGIRADSGYLQAKRDGYYFGFPKSKTQSAIDARVIVAQTIAQIEGQTIVTQYNNFGSLNSLHWAFAYIASTWDYDALTNKLPGLSVVKGADVYLTDIVPVYTLDTDEWNHELNTLGMLDNWGFSPKAGYAPSRPYTTLDGVGQYALQSPYEVDPVAINDYAKVTYEYVGPDGAIITETVNVDMLTDEQADYHQVRYTLEDGATAWFTYKQGTDVYPAIDNVFTVEYDQLGTYYPWAYMRFDGKHTNTLSGGAWYQVTKWCQSLGLDAEMISDAIEADPEVDDVEQAIVMFGMPPGSQEQEDLQYLFEYMLTLFNGSVAQKQKAQILQDKFGDYSNVLDQKITIRDREFHMDFAFSGISYARRTGSIASVGRYTGQYFTALKSSGQRQTSQPAYRYRRQSLPTVYDEVVVYNPNLFFDIKSGHGHTAKPGSKELLFPIDRAVLAGLGLGQKERVLARSIHMVVNTYVEIKSSWYESTFFKYIMVIVAVVLTVFTAGSAWQTIVAAAALGATAVAIVLLQYLALSMIANYAVKLFIKALGPEAAFFLAVAAMAVGAYGTSTQATWGENLLSLSTNLAQTANQEYVAELQSSFVDMASQIEGMEDAMDSLSQTRKDLGLNYEYSGLSGLDFVGYRPMTVFGESSSDFFTRTIHTGNIGATSMAMTEQFFDLKLMLPELKDTINEDNENGLPV